MPYRGNEFSLKSGLERTSVFADEIVVVSKIASHKMQEIVQKAGARLYSRTCNHGELNNNLYDYHLINSSLENLEGKWVLFLFSDEVLNIKDTDKFFALLRDSIDKPVTGFYLQIKRYFDKKRNYNYFLEADCRIIRNREEYRFNKPPGAVFESIEYILGGKRQGTRIIKTSYQIVDYDFSVRISKIKAAGKKEVNDSTDKNNNLAQLYFLQGRYKKTLDSLTEVIEKLKKVQLCNDDNVRGPDLVYLVILAYYYRGEYELALSMVNRGLKLYPEFRILWYLKGELLVRLKQINEARKAYHGCMAFPENAFNYREINGLGSFRSLLALGRLDEREGNEEKAVIYYLKAYESCPDYIPAEEGIRRVYKNIKDRVKAYLNFAIIDHNSCVEEVNLIYKWLEKEESHVQLF